MAFAASGAVGLVNQSSRAHRRVPRRETCCFPPPCVLTRAETAFERQELHTLVNSRPFDDVCMVRRCVLMFSGGRDSTLAALRLHDQGYGLTLVTVSSDHLVGIDAVRRRLREISRILPPDTRWLRLRQPQELWTDTSFYEKTCLPCHHAYVVVAAAVALSVGTKALAFGYVGYQSTWPEQTPMAIARLDAVLGRNGVQLLLPVYDLTSRDEAERELEVRGVSRNSLDQKCVQQVENVSLPEDKLTAQIALWERAIETSVSSLSLVEMNTIESTTLAQL